jgi:hypothetical protein
MSFLSWPAKHAMLDGYTCTYMYVLCMNMYIHITARHVHEKDRILPKSLIVSVGNGACPALKESKCQTRMAHSNYGQKERYISPHTGLEVLDQMQDAC